MVLVDLVFSSSLSLLRDRGGTFMILNTIVSERF